ncbi:MAG: VCBS repeat-containing protein [bacterium]|nr:VCBS repeat-containing protein [bacterium]
MGDLDGDGMQDLVFNRRTNLVNTVYVGLSTRRSGFLFTPLDMEHPSGETCDQYQLLTGDFDGDGRQDMAWYHPAATNRLYVALSVMDQDALKTTGPTATRNLGPPGAPDFF